LPWGQLLPDRERESLFRSARSSEDSSSETAPASRNTVKNKTTAAGAIWNSCMFNIIKRMKTTFQHSKRFVKADMQLLKEQCHDFLNFLFFQKTTPYWALINHQKYFKILFQIRWVF
jgi:arginine decarboxylase-like protein